MDSTPPTDASVDVPRDAPVDVPHDAPVDAPRDAPPTSSPARHPLDCRWLGTVAYPDALALQYRLAAERAAEHIPDTVLLLEHPAVITMGRRAAQSDILVEPARLQQERIAVHRVTRGGEVTYHGRGQLVGYIIFDMRSCIKRVAGLMHGIEEALIHFLHDEYRIVATSSSRHPGVWVGDGKIAAVGVSIQSGITIHGFALNIATDLRHFSYIVACGIARLRHTSVVMELARGVERGEALTGGGGEAPVESGDELERVAKRVQPHLSHMHKAFFG